MEGGEKIFFYFNFFFLFIEGRDFFFVPLFRRGFVAANAVFNEIRNDLEPIVKERLFFRIDPKFFAERLPVFLIGARWIFVRDKIYLFCLYLLV